MFSTLIIVASIVVLAGAIITSTLVTAKAALHAAVIAKTQTAMTDATAQFLGWAQNIAYTDGPEADWASPRHAAPPTFKLLCAPTYAGACPFGATITWVVTGATTGVAVSPTTVSAAKSQAQNMATAVDEQRISATITVLVTDATGKTNYGGRTREVTVRVFDASPYAVVTATHDSGADVGTLSQSEGDSGGALAKASSTLSFRHPDPSLPADYTDTTLKAAIDCANTGSFDENNPIATSDDGSSLVVPLRLYGSVVWSYQAACTPSLGAPAAPPSAVNYIAPVANVYGIAASTTNSLWNKGDQNTGSFER